MNSRVMSDAWQMVIDNMGLIFRHTQRLPSHAQEDAEQDAVFGLLRAAELYDPARGATFGTFADVRIRSAIREGRGRAVTMSDRRAIKAGEPETQMVSLDVPVGDATQTIGDLIASDAAAPDDIVEAAALRAAVLNIGTGRHEHDQAILGALFDWEHGDIVTLAAQFGVSKQRVHQRLARLRPLVAAAICEKDVQ